jgi:hypothetical protein
MQDDRGLYYFPFPSNKRVRMYVLAEEGTVKFRMWNQDDPDLWVEHGWVPYETIQEAAQMYTGKKFNPHLAYDITVAKELLNER